MLKHRLIPCVLLKDWQLVKSVQFGSFRTIGHPTATVRVYNARNVDELIVLDIDASLKGEPINTEIISDMANECFMPLTIGGGIKTIDDVYAVLGAGADKISINSQAIKNPSFIKEIATIFGSQCIVCSIDIKKVDGKYRVFNKKEGLLDIDPLTLAKEYERQGAGEILLTSVDLEGTTLGYDIELLKLFADSLHIPIIINGGMGVPQHGVEALQNGADALAAAYIFHFTQYTPQMIKEELKKSNYPVRVS
ncbi:MAG: HisA/HisF-related TIM barrel protein [Sulfurimonas sp.]|jgi:cyclase|uniref:imidazole glycerol phosphate synthase subunit HisF n=1 Tax=unclassified Sulfurimonas TaxID=2623549 RepID=UPI0008B6254E|nr:MULTISPECIES: HisA/HisF-related TIM barrel protein [unclassified Sulfurimonas]MBS4068881.1 imidazole glycerol phosphate synthase cyclase subunit [Sulfurimonas sp.]MDD3854517.1 HisA/HisF-related TIM barrel protein [Sulfurimonas sp.]OHE03432.1 MAG: imidazole glycerol phosphate synthase subunit HisF [Sulfurimonas sp. RIFOXYB12_FULL_35_9]